ncbi:MAG: hypothetical protein Kow00107_11000 [Planctomycetota bacterium]
MPGEQQKKIDAPVPPRVLVVDDDPHFLKLVKKNLENHGISVGIARNAEEAREEVKKNRPELIISDMMMPGTRGDELCRELQDDPDTAEIPFVFVSAVRDAKVRIQSFSAGAIDYLVKPINMEELAAKVLAMVRKSRTTRIIMLTDALTGAKNRWYFEEELPRLIQQARRGKWPLTLVIIDLNDFKEINDTYSHMFGDKVLSAVTRTLRELFRSSDVIIRYGGDEFVLALPETSSEDAVVPMNRLFEHFRSFTCETDEGEKVDIRIAAGVASFPEDGQDLASVFNAADQALYRVKKGGKNGYAFADESKEIKWF